ncbi:cyclin-dependent kinase inhibitor 1B [Eublepharis macularius]|uniref:Cyclin-dependent kinase inhibitor 1B n=1 Tax=Eublepharis macularius TaxID=481883 RepID=A0AA97KIL5_EUBMA|nr:cyclin-dependent kinase inhibitor 1B [Eublepharis macularius]
MKGAGGGGGAFCLDSRSERARLPRRLCPRPVRQPSRLGAAPAMSHVRLSNGSPTLERMEARQADYPKPSACRNLFGPVDHDELARELERQHRDLAEASRRKWNFDFQRHQPLDGRYEWQAVAHDALPDFYTRPPRLSGALAKPDGRRRSQGRAPEEPPRSAASEAPREPAAQGAGSRKRPAAEPDDSSHQNKRGNTTEVISEDSPSNYSVEQTPKKSSPRRHQT